MSYKLIGFYDQFDVGCGATEQVLTAGPLAQVPLDIPGRAEFSAPGGTVRHSGIGAVFRRELQTETSVWQKAWIAGLLLERLGWWITGFIIGCSQAQVRDGRRPRLRR